MYMYLLDTCLMLPINLMQEFTSILPFLAKGNKCFVEPVLHLIVIVQNIFAVSWLVADKCVSPLL